MKRRLATLAGLLAYMALVGCSGTVDNAPQGKEQPKAKKGKKQSPKPPLSGDSSKSNQQAKSETESTLPPAPPELSDSPEATWTAVKAANAAGDHKAFLSCFSPAYQKAMASRFAYTALQMQFMVGGSRQRDAEIKAQSKSFLDVLTKHGLTPDATKQFKSNHDRAQDEKNIDALAGLIKDPVTLYADLRAVLAKVQPKSERPSTEFEGDLTEVRIDGDKATAVLVLMDRGEQMKAPIKFVRVNGKWKLAPEQRRRSSDEPRAQSGTAKETAIPTAETPHVEVLLGEDNFKKAATQPVKGKKLKFKGQVSLFSTKEKKVLIHLAELYSGDQPAVQAAVLTKEFQTDRAGTVKKYKLEKYGDNVMIIEGVVLAVLPKIFRVYLAGHKD